MKYCNDNELERKTQIWFKNLSKYCREWSIDKKGVYQGHETIVIMNDTLDEYIIGFRQLVLSQYWKDGVLHGKYYKAQIDCLTGHIISSEEREYKNGHLMDVVSDK